MATKTLNTKIALLYKSYAEWVVIQSTYIPLKGEVCICEVPASTLAVVNEPCVLFKVGDGAKTFAQLPWTSALAADVYAWAKKENLDFNDLNATFLTALDARIASVETNTLYLIVADGDNKWKLLKSENGGSTWTDATGVIDLSSTIATLNASIATKVTKEITGTNGTSYIFNEADGGGAKFEGNNRVVAYVGTHDNIGGEIGTQIYVDKANGTESTIIDVTQNGAYYTKGTIKPGAQRDVPENEIATIGDISEYSMTKDADPGQYAAIYHLTKDGTNVGEPINIAKDQLLKSVTVKTCTEKDKPISGLNPGDKYIDFEFETTTGTSHSYIAVKDMVQPYTAGTGIEITSANAIKLTDAYITEIAALRTDLTSEASTRATADTALSNAIAAEETRAKAAEQALDNAKLNVLGTEPVSGQPYNLPYYFYTDEQTDKIVVHALTVTLDNNKTAGDYTLDVLPATSEKAGLMSATDKASFDNLADVAHSGNVNDLILTDGDVLILNCNF